MNAASADSPDPSAVKPDRELQEMFWNSWNSAHRSGGREINEYTDAQLRTATKAAERAADAVAGRRMRILELGCGSGWLAAGLTRFGDVTGVDLSDAAIAYGKSAYPEVTLLVGDVLEADVVGPIDLVVSADVISHVADQQAFVDRVAALLRPGGTFLLMTQNGPIWRRNSQLAPQQPGQIRNWPTLRTIRRMYVGRFSIVRVGTIHPVGDRGALRVINSRWISGPLRRVGLKPAWTRLRELARLGGELTIEARRI
jgi:2-polyprenyl-3-methyl-5-hydroxy-6-metoxy-1,4-benzoquinol methylase